MEIWVLFGVFTLLLIIGTPVAFCLGIASLATILYMQLPPVVVFQQLNSGMNAFAMMAIPFFIFAGDLMVRGGIADRLIRLAAGLVGHLRGGLGQVNVVASTLFGGISGSAIADASATAGIVPGLLLAAALMVTAYWVAVRRGYPADPFPGFRKLGRFFVAAIPGIL